MLRIPHCLGSRLTDGGKVVSLTRRPLPTPQKHCFPSPGTHFCSRLSEPQGIVRQQALGRLKCRCNSTQLRAVYTTTNVFTHPVSTMPESPTPCTSGLKLEQSNSDRFMNVLTPRLETGNRNTWQRPQGVAARRCYTLLTSISLTTWKENKSAFLPGTLTPRVEQGTSANKPDQRSSAHTAKCLHPHRTLCECGCTGAEPRCTKHGASSVYKTAIPRPNWFRAGEGPWQLSALETKSLIPSSLLRIKRRRIAGDGHVARMKYK
jgi:hypothetical protein